MEVRNGLQIIRKKDLDSPDRNNIGQKQPMLWDICPMDTVVPLLHCEIGTVNDQLYKKLFCQILSIESGSQIELDKRLKEMDINESLYQQEETSTFLSLNLTNFRQQIKDERQSLIQKKKSLQYKKRRLSHSNDSNDEINKATDLLNTQISSINLDLRDMDLSIKEIVDNINSVQQTISDDQK